ncbi:hypothetical protein DFJ77DRAFT_514906 [Powellomyces hirtus]|nr:hypothetical protein DFJ77DRAFT_514906 [Powellomyces hirtus]
MVGGSTQSEFQDLSLNNDSDAAGGVHNVNENADSADKATDKNAGTAAMVHNANKNCGTAANVHNVNKNADSAGNTTDESATSGANANNSELINSFEADSCILAENLADTGFTTCKTEGSESFNVSSETSQSKSIVSESTANTSATAADANTAKIIVRPPTCSVADIAVARAKNILQALNNKWQTRVAIIWQNSCTIDMMHSTIGLGTPSKNMVINHVLNSLMTATFLHIVADSGICLPTWLGNFLPEFKGKNVILLVEWNSVDDALEFFKRIAPEEYLATPTGNPVVISVPLLPGS